MIPLIQQEVVDKKGWLKESEFVEMMAIAQSAPGPIALNTAIFVGYKARGIKGVIFSSLGTILPSFIVILLIAIIFTDFKNNPGVERVFKGIRRQSWPSSPLLYTKWVNQQVLPVKPSFSRRCRPPRLVTQPLAHIYHHRRHPRWLALRQDHPQTLKMS